MSGKHSPSHMASSKGKRSSGKSGSSSSRRRREPLQDNYYYEEPWQEEMEDFEDVSSYSSEKRKREDLRELERQKKKKGSKAKKAILITLAVLVLLGAGIAYYIFGYLLKDLTVAPITKDKEELGIHSEVVEAYMDTSVKNIALFGLDVRDEKDTARSDAIMILTIDNKHRKIKMTSVLRDSNVSMKMTDSDGYTYYTDDKITHAYFYGGPELAMNTLNRNFYLRIEDYVSVNFAQMAEIVDAVGGIDLELSGDEAQEVNRNLFALSQEVRDEKYNDQWNDDYDENDYPMIWASDYLENSYGGTDFEYTDFDDKVYHLSGNAAVAYGRIRHLVGGDNVRSTRQQNVLKALIEAVRGKSKLEYPEIIRKLMPMCTTSLDFTDIIEMIPIMFTDFTIETISVPGDEEDPGDGYNSSGAWVYTYDLEEAARHIHRFIYEEDANLSVIGSDDHVRQVSELRYSAQPVDWSEPPPEDDDDLLSSMPEDDEFSSNPEGDDPWEGDGDDDPWSGDGDGDGDGYDDPGGGGYDTGDGYDEGGGSDGDDWIDAAPNGEVNS